MPMTWNDQADAKLLVGILSTAKPKLDFDTLAAYMGPECTAYAIQHRIRKLKDQVKSDNNNNNTTGSALSTPQKRKKGGKQANENGSSPKKVKAKAKATGAGVVKKEDGEEDEDSGEA